MWCQIQFVVGHCSRHHSIEQIESGTNLFPKVTNSQADLWLESPSSNQEAAFKLNSGSSRKYQVLGCTSLNIKSMRQAFLLLGCTSLNINSMRQAFLLASCPTKFFIVNPYVADSWPRNLTLMLVNFVQLFRKSSQYGLVLLSQLEFMF